MNWASVILGILKTPHHTVLVQCLASNDTGKHRRRAPSNAALQDLVLLLQANGDECSFVPCVSTLTAPYQSSCFCCCSPDNSLL